MSGVNVGTAYLEIIPSAKGFAGKLQGEVGSQMAATGKSAGDKAGKGFGSSFGGRVKSILGAVGGLAVGAAAVGFLKDSISEARESQKVSALTAQVIKTTGGAANITAKQMGQLSTAISLKTGIDDEQIQSGANMLLTFKNIRNEAGKNNKIFNQATGITTDMAASLAAASGGQIDLRSTSIQVGKALNDPVKGMTALSRVGVTFNDQQKKQVTAMVKSGNTLGAQKIILKELKSEFGGSAASMATNGEKMSVAFGNFKEMIGTALLPVLDRLEGWISGKAIPALTKFFGEMQSGTGTGGKVASVLHTVATVLGAVAGFLLKNKTAAGAFIAVLVGFSILRSIRDGFIALNIAMEANPIGLVVVAIAALAAGLVYAYKHSETFRNIVNSAFHAIATAASFMWDKVIKPAFKAWISLWFTVVGAILNGAAKAFGWVPGIGGKLKSAAKHFDDFKNHVNASLNGIHDKTVNVNVKMRAGTTVKGLANAANFADLRGVGSNARGTNDWRGGPTWVGENGPEILNLPKHSQVIPNHRLGTVATGARSGGQEIRGTLGIDRDGVAYIHGIARDAVGAGNAAAQQRARHSSLDGIRR